VNCTHVTFQSTEKQKATQKSNAELALEKIKITTMMTNWFASAGNGDKQTKATTGTKGNAKEDGGTEGKEKKVRTRQRDLPMPTSP
jgi:hypothetical protein